MNPKEIEEGEEMGAQRNTEDAWLAPFYQPAGSEVTSETNTRGITSD